MKPIRKVDHYFTSNDQLKGQKGEWFITKPIMIDTIFTRVRDAIVVLFGRATAFTFYEDAGFKPLEKMERVIKFKAHGEDIKVSMEELIRLAQIGYTYTKKT